MHSPVLLNEVCEFAKGLEFSPRWIWDATLGRGGHTKAFLELFPQATVIGTDRDSEALQKVGEQLSTPIEAGRLVLTKFNFHDGSGIFKNPDVERLGINQFDMVLMDLGVSSPQLDDSHRGFSFYHEGPLDMRMDADQTLSAAEIVNTWSEIDLQRLFSEYGEVHRPYRVVKQILNERAERPFVTTTQLAQLIERAEGWKKKGHHPATRYFLALRMRVNDELDGLKEILPEVMSKVLSPAGRLMVITFHSLEDRIAKQIFKNSKEVGAPVNKKVVQPSREEILANPRARSAKLRVFQRSEEQRGTSDEQTSSF